MRLNAPTHAYVRVRMHVRSSELNLSDGLHRAFDMLVARQLDPVWHSVSWKTRQITRCGTARMGCAACMRACVHGLHLVVQQIPHAAPCMHEYARMQHARAAPHTLGVPCCLYQL